MVRSPISRSPHPHRCVPSPVRTRYPIHTEHPTLSTGEHAASPTSRLAPPHYMHPLPVQPHTAHRSPSGGWRACSSPLSTCSSHGAALAGILDAAEESPAGSEASIFFGYAG